MPYNNTIENLKKLKNRTDINLTIYLLTDKNLYSFRNETKQNEKEEFFSEILKILSEEIEYKKYNSSNRTDYIIYYLYKESKEYKSLDLIKDLYSEIKNKNYLNNKNVENIGKTEKIKLFIFKCEEIMFLYRYNSSSIFKQSWIAKLNNKMPIVEKNCNKFIILNKTKPDIIFDIKNDIALLTNVIQSEYILSIDQLFMNSIDKFNSLKIISESTENDFIDKVKSSNKFIRKLHKIISEETYKHFENNIDNVKDVIKYYNLDIKLDENSNKILFDENTEINDVLHLLGDDYIRKYISQKDDILS